MQIHRKNHGQSPIARKAERAVHSFLDFLLDDSARREILLAVPHARAARRHKPKTRIRRRSIPHWDAWSRRLWFGATLIKEFNVPAKNQELVLAAFEEQSWPECIDDPLRQDASVDSKERLHNTLIRLNRAHRHRVIHFGGNGNGLGVKWTRIPKAAKSAS
jgi:hypothetical protein